MAEQTAMHRATEQFENAARALRSATTYFQKASSGQPWPLIQAAMEEMMDAQEHYEQAEGLLRHLTAYVKAAKQHRFA